MALGRAAIFKFHFREATPASGSASLLEGARQEMGREEGAVTTFQQLKDKGYAKLLGMERKGKKIRWLK